jgi:hypothetical protein
MALVLGTESEVLVVGDGQLSDEPAGLSHAVDPAVISDGTGVLAYAVCGTPVRVWPKEGFDPDGADVHQGCAVRLG